MISDGALATIVVCIVGVVIMAITSFVRDWSKGREHDRDIAEHDRRITQLEGQNQEVMRLLREQYGMIQRQDGKLDEVLMEVRRRSVGQKP